MNRSLFLAVSSTMALGLANLPARADEEPMCTAAEAAIHRGVELRAVHDDLGALTEFKKAQRMCPNARATAQIALAEQALGRWLEAEEHMKEALSAAGDPWIAKSRATLDQALATIAEHLGDLEVVAPRGPRGAEVYFNEHRVGVLPLARPARVVAGSSTLEVRAAGYHTLSRTVKVTPAGLAREVVELTRIGEEAPGGAAGSASPRSLRTTLGWVGLPVGVVILAGGIAAHVIRERKASEWNDDDRCLFVDSQKNRSGNCGPDRDTVYLAQDLAIAGYVVGGVITAASAALLLWPSRQEQPRPAGITCGPGPGAVGLSCAGHF